MEPEAEKSGLARHTSASIGSCQASPRSVARPPRATAEKASEPASETHTQTGSTAHTATAIVPANSAAGTAAWQASKAMARADAMAATR